jgi:hypothetical protein
MKVPAAGASLTLSLAVFNNARRKRAAAGSTSGE